MIYRQIIIGMLLEGDNLMILNRKAYIFTKQSMEHYKMVEKNLPCGLMVLLFLVGVQTLSSLQYGFSYDPSQDPSNGRFNSYISPSYSLGTLFSGTSINIKVTLPNPLNAALFSPWVIFSLYKFDGSNYVQETANIIASTPTYVQVSYDVIFPTSDTVSTDFELRAIGPIVLSQLDYFYLEVTSYNTSTGLSVAGNSMQTILKITETFRNSFVKYIYVSNPNNLTISVTPAFTTPTYTASLSRITDATVTRSNGFQKEPALPGSVNYNALQQMMKFSYSNVQTGFYVLNIYPDSTAFPGVRTVTVNFQSDAYLCPYSPEFYDYYQNFQGCTKTPSSDQGPPCLSYQTITGQCLECMSGYVLSNGKCLTNTICPDRFYFHFGQCLPVNTLCGKYQEFTGICLNCNDPDNYYLSEGSCNKKEKVQCVQRQWIYNNTCINVSPTCQTFDGSNGDCLTCFDMYQLVGHECVLAKANCSINQYAVGFSCVPIPVECLNFDRDVGRCLTCNVGYALQQGYCYRIQCPQRQVPSKIGAFCVDVSSLCDQYDTTTGDCITCKYSSYSLRNGQCLQAVSPLAGCQERQNMGFGQCANVTLNCKTFNLKTGDCEACEPGFYIDYTGVCVANAICGPKQWSVNGMCMGMPDNCIAVNSLGFCISCVDNTYRIIDGQCVYFQTCLPRQYLSSIGKCIYVSPDCDAYNPSNGQCITCVSGKQPSGGVCCPVSTTFSQGSCVSNTVQQNNNQAKPSCLIRHPSLNFCLKCPDGYTPDYTIPFNCVLS